jgi:MFS family permease
MIGNGKPVEEKGSWWLLFHTVTCVLTFQITHTMFNVVFPFVLKELVAGKALVCSLNSEGGGKTLHVKTIFDVSRIIICCIIFPVYGVISDLYGRKLVLYILIASSLLAGAFSINFINLQRSF